MASLTTAPTPLVGIDFTGVWKEASINNFDNLVGFYPDNCSVTKILNNKSRLELMQVGNELSTVIQ